MRTTVTLDDDLFHLLEQLARKGDAPLKQVLNAALRRGLGAASPQPPLKPYRAQTFDCALLPGADPLHFNRLLDDLDTEDFVRETRRRP